MEFTLAHFSDVHLGPVPWSEVWKDFALKRIIGGLSWHLRRKSIHINEIAAKLMTDIRLAAPDHLAFTGDLVNIAARGEFERARAWLASAADPDHMTFAPGNHDAYVAIRDFGDLGVLDAYASRSSYPKVRHRRNVAIIALNTALPQGLGRASGTLGEQQCNALAVQLRDTRARGFYRVVLLHHPPMPGLNVPRKALTDAARIQQILAEHGAELVLHGHNHRRMINWLDSATGPIPVIGVPSASSSGARHTPPAEWHLHTIDRHKGVWRTRTSIRVYNGAQGAFEAGPDFLLHPAAALQ